MKEALDILKKYWKYPSFREGQEDIVRSVLEGKDTLALLPTGGGKSVCFQVPALLREGVTIVISPLIALMKDQVEGLQKKGIAAQAIHSGMEKRQVERILDNAVAGTVKLLYLSPERLLTSVFKEHLRIMEVGMIVVDEAHCISQWGYDFRPPYLRIAEIREWTGNAPMIALTATATDQVCNDICEKLEMKAPAIFKTSFDRPNMHLIVRKEEDKWGKLKEVLQRVPGTAVIYVRNRRKTKEIAQFLQRNRISADFYHAGRNAEERSMVQERWINGAIRVVACTNAFGMGIDKADVRLVLHWDIPDSPEAYFQEAGRAGRDGNRCFAGIIYTAQDDVELKSNLTRQYPPPEEIRKTYHALSNMLQIASGAGAGQTFPLDMESLMRYNKQDPVIIAYALRVLQHQGFIYINDTAQYFATIFVPISHEDLYRYQIENRQSERILKAILRAYPGIFDDHVAIREGELAHHLSIPKAEVVNMLNWLHKQEVIEYQPASNTMRVTYLTERYRPEDLPLDIQMLRKIKEQAEIRVDAMLDYVQGNPSCRMQKMLRYFGEESPPCNRCDYCLERDKLDLKDDDITLTYNWLKEHLKDGSVPLTAVVAEKFPIKKKKFLEALSYLTDNNMVRYVNNNELEWRD